LGAVSVGDDPCVKVTALQASHAAAKLLSMDVAATQWHEAIGSVSRRELVDLGVHEEAEKLRVEAIGLHFLPDDVERALNGYPCTAGTCPFRCNFRIPSSCEPP
jgi:tartrate dehydratase beta subunit/fumarate hydratase class I family protein